MEEKAKEVGAQAAHRELKGVGGWLLFFIVTAGISMVLEVKELKGLIDAGWEDYMHTGMVAFLCLAGALDCLYVFGIFSLATVKGYAVRLIKVILIVYPLFCVVSPAFIFVMVGLTSGMDLFHADVLSAFYSGETIATIVGAVVRSAIWFAYFSVSVRVKNTWPVAQRVGPEAVFS